MTRGPAKTKPLLQIRDLSVEFPGVDSPIRVLDGCSFEVGEGDIFGLVGEGGSGKSILPWAILNLVPAPGRVVDGEVLFEGRKILSLGAESAQLARGSIAVLPPNGRSLLNPTSTVGSQIALMRRTHHSEQSRQEDRDQVLSLLQRVGMPDPRRIASAYSHELSGGMAQRAVIAIVLACSPRLLIADEMTANLDVTVQAQILDSLTHLVREEGLSVLYITRDLGIVASYCNTVGVLSRGRIAECGPVPAFLLGPASEPGRGILEASMIAENRSPGPGDSVRRLSVRSQRAGSQTEPILRIEGLVKRYRSSRAHKRVHAVVHAVNGVDLSILAGESVGLVGESGSGKSTLARCVLGLVDPSEGRIWYQGENVTHRRAEERGDLLGKIQLVFQDPYESLNPRWTVRRALSDPLRLLLGVRGRDLEASLLRLLHLVDLPNEVLDKYPHELTGGVQQLVGIARAMAPEPRLLLLDEPTSRLDAFARHRIIETLRRIQAETGVAYLFISHDLVAVKGLASRIAVMYLGRVVEEGDVDEMFSRPMHPYTCALLSSFLEAKAEGERHHVALLGEIPSPTSLPSGCFLHPRCPAADRECASVWPDLKPRGQGQRQVACIRIPDDAPPDWSGWELVTGSSTQRPGGWNDTRDEDGLEVVEGGV